MQTLARSLRGVTERIKVPWKSLEKAISPGPGHIILVTGAPGVGKSAFGLWWAVHMDSPALVLSLDSDLATQAARTVSMLTGIPFDQVKENIPEWEAFLRTMDRTLPMVVDLPMTVDKVDEVVYAFKEFYSRPPSVVVVDNLKDVVSANTYEAHCDAVRELIRVAKKHKTTIILLHHVSRQSRVGSGTKAPPLDAGTFTGEQDAPFVLGLWQGWDQYTGPVLNVQINKNRFGPKDFAVPLRFDFSRMWFSDE